MWCSVGDEEGSPLWVVVLDRTLSHIMGHAAQHLNFTAGEAGTGI